jgi:zinc transporter
MSHLRRKLGFKNIFKTRIIPLTRKVGYILTNLKSLLRISLIITPTFFNMLEFDKTYGSDQYGMVWGYYFSPGQPAQWITAIEAHNFLHSSQEHGRGDFFWLHFALSNAASENWLKRHFALPDSFYLSLNNGVQSSRLEKEGNALVAVIYDVLFDFTFDPEAIAAASLYIEPRFIISARLRPLRSVDQLKIAVQNGQIFRSTIELLAHLLERQAQVLVDILKQSTIHVDQIEDSLLASRIAISRRELGILRRLLVRLQRLLAPEPSAFFRLLSHPMEWITEEDLQTLQQAAEEFSTTIDNTISLIERVKLLQDEITSLVNEQTNHTLYILTIVTVIALPINIVAGLFGMNVGGIPLADNNHGFLTVVFILFSLTSSLIYLTLIRRRH